MKQTKVATGVLWLALAPWPHEWAGAAGVDEEQEKPIPMALALRLGPQELTKLIDWGESEAGQDDAASIYAAAVRAKTEYALALRDVRLVGDLDQWRRLLSGGRRGVWEIASARFGGGTMWGHNARREAAPVEDFLAELATRLPLAMGKGSKDAAKQIDGAISHVNSLEADSEVTATLRTKVREVTARWMEIRNRISTLSKEEADRIAGFVVQEAMSFEKAGEG